MNVAERIRWRLWRRGSSNEGSLSTTVLVVVVGFLLIIAYRPFLNLGYAPVGKVKSAEVQIDANFTAALDTFKAKVGRYPTTAKGLHVLTMRDMDEGGAESAPLLSKIPRDPWGNEYQYACPGVHNPDSYDLYSLGPDNWPGTADNIANWPELPPEP